MKALKVLGLVVLIAFVTWLWIIPQVNKYRESKKELNAIKRIHDDIKLNPGKYFRFIK